MKSKYQSQQIVKEDNERKILVLLRENPLRFNELLSGTGLSRRGLSEFLIGLGPRIKSRRPFTTTQ
ncbi:MAG: hypothetical protein ACYDCP_00450 [Thermoplasmataceae archaeon]